MYCSCSESYCSHYLERYVTRGLTSSEGGYFLDFDQAKYCNAIFSTIGNLKVYQLFHLFSITPTTVNQNAFPVRYLSESDRRITPHFNDV